jgi:hypothetical protein
VTAPALPRDEILESVLHDCRDAHVDVCGMSAHGHSVRVDVESSEDLVTLSRVLLDVVPVHQTWVMGRYASVDLQHPARPAYPVHLAIHVGGAR